MAISKRPVPADHRATLTKLVHQVFGKPLTHSFECELLSKDIEKVTNNYISPQTLRRTFGFLDSDFSPSVKTLNILSQYVGFPNWYSVMEHAGQSTYTPLQLDQEANLYLDFYQINVKTEADMNYHNACRNIAFRILFNPALLSKLSSSLARNPVSQIYFFERFPFIDGLRSEYKRSVQLYLQKKTDEAQVFGNSLLLLAAFLGGKSKEVKNYCEKINQTGIREAMHPFIVARIIGSNILKRISFNESIHNWLEEAQKWNLYFLHKGSYTFWHYPYFQHMMSDYLNLAGMFKESNGILRAVQQTNKNYEIEKGYEEALEVISRIARHPSSSDDFKYWFTTTKAFESIHPLFRKFYELQAHCVYRSVLPNGLKKQKTSDRINELIAQTGFVYFSTFLIVGAVENTNIARQIK